MSYQVLARKWRPRSFAEMVGQEHVLKALINALDDQRLHHAYLFTGTRGVGKTTIARILAKCLNCEQGVGSTPCGECSSCRAIAEGRFVDLIEVDAASRTKVEDTRELLDNVQYAPTHGRYKVYLIDEVHMLSTHSFNALLKTLEEPPEHVKFLLATTDPQKLPVTVLSRCLQFSLKNMTPQRIVEYLAHVLQQEDVSYDEPALWQLGRAAQGSMRDALSLTDQAIAYGHGEVKEEQVVSMLGTMDRGRLFRLAAVMASANAVDVLAEVAAMAEHGPDFDEVIQGLMHIWHRTALAQVAPDAIDNAEGDREAILKLAVNMTAEDVQLCYQIAGSGRQDLTLAPDPRQGFEMVLLRMLAFRPAPAAPVSLELDSCLEAQPAIAGEKKNTELTQSVAPLVNAKGATDIQTPVPELTAELAAEQASGPVVEPQQSQEPASEQVPALEPEPNPQPEPAPEPECALETMPAVNPEPESVPEPAPALESERNLEPELTSESEADPEPVAERAPEINRYELQPHNWWQWLEQLPLAGMTAAIARSCALVQIVENQYYFDLDPDNSALYNDAQRQRLQQAMAQTLGSVVVHIDIRPPRGETPDQRRQRLQREAWDGAAQALRADPAVQMLLEQFGATVDEHSIQPLQPS